MLMVFVLIRNLVILSKEQIQMLPRFLIIFGVVAAYEISRLRFINSSLQKEKNLPSWNWALNIIIETLFPSASIFMLTETSYVGPYLALAAPAILLYFIFIIFSTLYLSPKLSYLSGLSSCLGYIFLVIYTYQQYPDPAPHQKVFSLEMYLTYAFLIFLGGVIAGAIAGQIRNHVLVALREAETKRQLDLVKRDLKIAQQIQKSTLPSKLPKLPTFDIDAWNEPAEETGGDIYDVIGYQIASDNKSVLTSAEKSDRAILLLADATGHGIGPALSVTQLRAMLRMAVHISPDISTIAKHVNEQLCNDLPADHFITAWLGEIDSSQNTLKYFSAGQGPLLRYNAETDEVEFFDSQSCPFGVTDSIDTTPSDPISMRNGDIFAVISDGIFESINSANEQFGSDRTIKVLKQNKDLSVRDILNALRMAVDQFTKKAPADDDRTIIIIKRN
jgi:serine phosphatase RsbU (regulator of sigma subunit)